MRVQVSNVHFLNHSDTVTPRLMYMKAMIRYRVLKNPPSQCFSFRGCVRVGIA